MVEYVFSWSNMFLYGAHGALTELTAFHPGLQIQKIRIFRRRRGGGDASTDPCDDAFAKFSRSFSEKTAQKKLGNDSFHRRDRFRQIFVQIGAILAIFRPFELFGRFWSVNGALMGR